MNSTRDVVKENLRRMADNDRQQLEAKDASYGSSWRKRGGIGAFMMVARKFDRLNVQFKALDEQAAGTVFKDGDSVANDVRDMRRYCLLIAEARSVKNELPTNWDALADIGRRTATTVAYVAEEIVPDADGCWRVIKEEWEALEEFLLGSHPMYDILKAREPWQVDGRLQEILENLYVLDYLWLTQDPAWERTKEVWTRDDTSTQDVLGLVSTDVPLHVIREWTDEQCQEAEAWGGARHLKASDNDEVVVPPVPEHVKQYENNADIKDREPQDVRI